MPKISVYTPTYNCARYLKTAINSILKQTYQDFELIIIDDASSDNTCDILDDYKNNPKIKIFRNEKNIGFVRSAIRAIEKANGEYIMRLDADDYLDENALFVMANILDNHPEFGMVYPDYFEIDEKGNIIDYFRKNKIGEEIKLMDLPANGACTLMRKSCYKSIGGYRDDIRMQDKYDIWIKFLKKFEPYNVNLPLFYYRRHGGNISNNAKKILQTRRYIKEKFIEKKYKKTKPKILAIIPTRAKFPIYSDFPIRKIAGKPLIYYPIRAIKGISLIKKAIFVTEDKDLAKEAKKHNIETMIRPEELATSRIGIEPTIKYVLNQVKKKNKFIPDIVVILFITSPLITSEHVKAAIDTLMIYDADSIISVQEDKRFHHKHGRYGLEPIFEKRLLRQEKDLLFEEIGSLVVTKRKFITDKNLFGKKIGHIALADEEAIDIDNKFKFWLAEQIIKNRNKINKLT
ncbi:MAG: glycosyltransferase [Parcubacteria group bacterium]